MPGRKLVLDTPFTGSGQPVLPTVDPIESVGSLFLIEPTHPGGSWAAGVPANGNALTNILASRAQAVTGSSTGLGGRTYRVGTATSDGTTLMERTGKGGLHVAVDPADTTAAPLSLSLYADSSIWNFLRANQGHVFYWSIWHRITRPATPTNGARTMWAGGSAYPLFENDRTSNAAQGARPAVNTSGPVLRNAAGVTSSSSALGSVSHQATNVFAGANGALTYNLNSADKINKMGSHIFYRAYIEDLTVSGRSYAAVDAIDNALFTKEVLTSGGRYFGDTFTDPTTIF